MVVCGGGGAAAVDCLRGRLEGMGGGWMGLGPVAGGGASGREVDPGGT